METKKTLSNTSIWTGRVISILCILFLLVDAIMKVVKSTPSMEGSIKLGWPGDAVMGLGIVLLICTILYALPRTAILGAVLLTGYLGGAVAVMVCAHAPYYFPIVFGILVWVGLGLRDPNVRLLFSSMNKTF
ncbi:DoxX-like protein [Chitinophaga niastensis]|uniref:DoxX-like protein n=1 Tax=Chitinophaga niastensis TaxID=536980 RepID=A0A2P8HK13_CHINA|nr:DoxX family protein [Chitinophaga niastensis]PSL46554.1 DoxX-like protein [Chitinophaga niastensis]